MPRLTVTFSSGAANSSHTLTLNQGSIAPYGTPCSFKKSAIRRLQVQISTLARPDLRIPRYGPSHTLSTFVTHSINFLQGRKSHTSRFRHEACAGRVRCDRRYLIANVVAVNRRDTHPSRCRQGDALLPGVRIDCHSPDSTSQLRCLKCRAIVLKVRAFEPRNPDGSKGHYRAR